MSFFDRLLGRDPGNDQPQGGYGQGRGGRAPMSEDERAIERYRYMLRTAPPDQIEQAHAEAFAQLTPEQRQAVLAGLAQAAPDEARNASDDPRSLARLATRAEMRQPGTLERTWAGGPGGGGGGFAGGMPGFGTFFLASIAGTVVGSAIAQSFFADSGYDSGAEGGDTADGGDSGDGGDSSDGGWGGDQAGYDGSGDAGDAGDTGDAGGFGDFGGGDFGGGDFGGGDFGGI